MGGGEVDILWVQEGGGDIDDISNLAFGRLHGRDDTQSCMPCGFFNELEGEIDPNQFPCH